MTYFNYHATAKRLIEEGKLIRFYFTENHNNISPALVLVFDDKLHPIMPIREQRWDEYYGLLYSRKWPRLWGADDSDSIRRLRYRSKSCLVTREYWKREQYIAVCSLFQWCGWQDLNLHTGWQWNLNPSCLPIPPHPQLYFCVLKDTGCILP